MRPVDDVVEGCRIPGIFCSEADRKKHLWDEDGEGVGVGRRRRGLQVASRATRDDWPATSSQFHALRVSRLQPASTNSAKEGSKTGGGATTVI